MSGTPVFKKPTVLVCSGSCRSKSFNKQLAVYSANLLKEIDVNVIYIDLRDYPMPVYNGDDEEETGLPQSAKDLKQKFIESDGLLFTCPEYNGSVTALFKNTVDWISRPHMKDEPTYVAFKGKAAALLSTSPGGLGGLRSLHHYREILTNLGCNIIANQAAVGGAYKAFDDKGDLLLDSHKNMVTQVLQPLVKISGFNANQEMVCSLQNSQAERPCGEYGYIAIAK
ncbi:hypothetical protein SARC_01279 [Sphaeroforma arctica JP610]|uniref:NADPH-dependent FMN reductase-like domain-containing protein n=1 Tax=Sphaeroforma arctica JP610 TaxID=667725 RepID=A0A0L0GED9_9EUKA|nr:hypothetical protein SARC_01279 [Sphaeroforma arctica JP610]KNC86598.1 hypothetical protein SARC_01279 [Sphaeroforma arctica JP610]|eukprot:XP_014160500.1 hypothetical protein SARC_01279 [Sphaeroforma arctica JP610]